jgi:hypothetical protein
VHKRTPQTDEILRRVGRNVVNFQQVEYLLKHLNAHAAIHAPASQLTSQLEKQIASVHRSTMGELAGRMVSNVLRPQEEHQSPDEIDEPWFGFRFTVETDTEFVDRHDQEMRALVDARNDLIHHFLPHWQAAVDGDVDSALAYLDAQLDDTLRMKDRLENWAQTMSEAKKQMAEFFASPEGAHQIKLGLLQSSRLVAMLGEIAMRTARLDGWAMLSAAGHLIKREAPDELEDLHKRFGHRNLKGVLLAAEFFDVADEPLPAGGVRTIYRINDRYELTLPTEETPTS